MITSPFIWRQDRAPSIFAQDKAFTLNHAAKGGRSVEITPVPADRNASINTETVSPQDKTFRLLKAAV